MSWLHDDRAVSEVLGNILMVAITVAMVAVLAFMLASQPVPNDPGNVDLVARSNATDVVIQHRGGESIALDRGHLRVTDDGGVSAFPLTDRASDFAGGDPDAWDIGETLCASCTVTDRSTVTRVAIILDGRVIATWNGRVLAPAPGERFTYVTSADDEIGTITDLANARSETDGGAEARLQEADTSAIRTDELDASSVVSAPGWTDPANAFVSDDQYATDDRNNPQSARYAIDDLTDPGDAINRVVIKAELSIQGHVDDDFRIAACLGGMCPESLDLGVNATDAIHTFDVTNAEPGDGKWTPSEIQNLDVKVIPIKNGPADGTWRIDHVFVEVEHRDPAFEMEIRTRISPIPAGTTHVVEMGYRVDGDSFDAQVWDGSSWNTRGDTLDATTATEWTYTLAAGEVNGGEVRIRFVDQSPDATQSNIFIDYLRVVTT